MTISGTLICCSSPNFCFMFDGESIAKRKKTVSFTACKPLFIGCTFLKIKHEKA